MEQNKRSHHRIGMSYQWACTLSFALIASATATNSAQSNQPDENIQVNKAARRDIQLSAEQITYFTLKVQPLLQRSCSMGGCHTPTYQGDFQLTRAYRTNRRTTQKNLHMVLGYIDTDRASSSPLILQALRAHGGASRPPLYRSRNRAFQTLEQWVLDIVGPEKQPQQLVNQPIRDPAPKRLMQELIAPGPYSGRNPAETLTPPPSSNLVGFEKTESIEVADESAPIIKQAGAVAPLSINNAVKPLQTQAPTPGRIPKPLDRVQPTAPYTPVDPFDPEIFNRRYLGAR